MFDFSHLFSLLPLEFFARAGGGGSGGGGSGGDGGGGIFFILGYLPMHFIGALLAKPTKKYDSLALKVIVNIVGWAIGIAYVIFWITVWRGFGFFIGLAALAGMGAGLYGWFGKLKQSPMIKKALGNAAANDSAWSEDKLLAHARDTFVRYQQDWSNFDTDAMKAYLTEGYLMHAWLLMQNLSDLNRRDIMTDVTIKDIKITNLHDDADNSQDRFTVGIIASAHDQLIETKGGNTLFTDTSEFTEYWTFQRSGNTWLLAGISQATASYYSHIASIEKFASDNGYYYSLDMGWLFIPKRGQLFNGSRFGKSDINNHVIGLYNDKLLIQIYSYIRNPESSSSGYVVAQASLPKSYGEIVVRRRKGLRTIKGIGGLQKVETEWPDFNKKYQVFASDAEQATSFELLNPTYMEQLEALGFEVDIEVVDNVVYLYTSEASASVAVYSAMLDLLHKAYKEMRL